MSAKRYSSINNSPTKQRYSFGRAERFPKISTYGAIAIYNLPKVNNPRATSFGYGGRYKFGPRRENITPSAYDYSYGVESNQPYAPKYSFGVSRENMKDNLDRSVPGPGKYYCTLKTFGIDGAKYSIKGKYPCLFDKVVNSPGPAAYDPATKINPTGVFGISKFKNVQSVDLRGDGDRFKERRYQSPGPAAYKNDNNMFGNIYNSRYKSTHGIHLGSRYKPYSFDINNNPGPGTYECYGDFSRYGDTSFGSNKGSGKNNESNNQSPNKKEENEEKNEESKENNENEESKENKENEEKKESEEKKDNEGNGDKKEEEQNGVGKNEELY